MTQPTCREQGFLERHYVLAAVIISVVGLCWRITPNLDWPYLHFEMVQYESAMVARKFWIAMDPAQLTPERQLWRETVGHFHITSPPILPFLVSCTYLLLGHEEPWIAGIWSSL